MTAREWPAWSRADALKRIAALPWDVIEDVARVIETAETQGQWCRVGGDDEGSVYEDDVAGTLNALAAEIREAAGH